VLSWQARHGWPKLQIAGQIRAEYGTTGQWIGFVVLQLMLFSVGASVLWIVASSGPGGAPVALQSRGTLRWIMLAGVLVTSALTVPVALPVLPAGVLACSPWSGPAEVQRESVGWPHLVAIVAAAYQSLPPSHGRPVIYATNYGEAGVIDRYGPPLGLPHTC